jgi:hypothetical protein
MAGIVTGFSAVWLALREAADSRARDASLTAQLAQFARPARPAQPALPARFIDLACGTGANLRYLAPRVVTDLELSLVGEQRWLLVDRDAALLARIGNVAGCRIETRQLDLVTGLHSLAFEPGIVVTASALLDLVSDRWLTPLVERISASRCAALFALSYDGRISLTPTDPDDEWICQLVNRHQLGDKGFGPALGPHAGQRTAELFRDAGYHVHTARSDWNLLPAEQRLQQALLEGWAAAAMELVPDEADRCRHWLARRLAHVANEASRITVGHEDVLALPH